jgi:hypothetical protein
MSRRPASQRGTASVEYMGMLWLLFLAGLCAWQILLVTSTVTSAENAARAASRAASRGGGGTSAGRNALPNWLADDASIRRAGDTALVTVQVPIVFPGLSSDEFEITRRASFPQG